MNKKAVTKWLILAIIFLIIAIVAGIFGFGFISGVSYTIAKWLAIIFIVLFIIAIIARTIKNAQNKRVYETIIGVLALVAAIWVIYDVLMVNKRLSDGMKIIWIILAIFFSIITAIIYYLIGRDNKLDLFKK